MINNRRQHKRIEKPLTIQFCLADSSPKKWDMSVIKNISIGGVSFIASGDLKLDGKIIQLQIKVPVLVPRFLEVEAMVLDVKPRLNIKFSDVRAKFINISEANKKDLSIVEKFIDSQDAKK